MKRRTVGFAVCGSLFAGFLVGAFATPAGAAIINHYSFDGNANDSVNGFDGTVFGATLTSDRFGNPSSAYYFDGADDYIDIGNPGLTNFADDFSFSAWINPGSDPQSTWPTIISKWSGDSYYETFWFGLRQASDGLGGEVTDDLGNHYQDHAVSVNTWQHVVMAYDKDAEALALYVDGDLLQSWNKFAGGSLSNNPAHNIFIGAVKRATFVHLYKGAIDDVRIYNHALGASEVRTLAAIPEPASLVVWSLLGMGWAGVCVWRRRRG